MSRITIASLLLIALAMGCSGSSSSTSAPDPFFDLIEQNQMQAALSDSAFIR
jgi:hypothetical protein